MKFQPVKDAKELSFLVLALLFVIAAVRCLLGNYKMAGALAIIAIIVGVPLFFNSEIEAKLEKSRNKEK